MQKQILLLFGLIVLISCSKEVNDIEENDPEEKIESDEFFRLSNSNISTSSSGAEYTVKIFTNSNWEVLSKPDWASINPLNGNGEDEIQIIISENSDIQPRTDYIEFLSFGETFKLMINQESTKLRLLSYSGSDNIIRMKEPKFLLFNKPIKVNSISSGDERFSFHAGPDDVEYFDSNHGLKFTAGPSTLGTEPKYKISVSDNEGNTFEQVIEIKFYTEKIVVPGIIKKVIMDEEKNLWVLTINSRPEENSYLYKFQIDDNQYAEVLKINLDIKSSHWLNAGGSFCINPYNNYLYVTDIYDKEVEVYSKEGSLIKKFTIPQELSNSDHSPIDIAFIKSGKGIIKVGYFWKFIDSANNDIITDPSSTHDHYYSRLKKFTLNQDQTKLFVMEDRSTVLKIFDGTETFKIIHMHDLYPTIADAVRITQNRFNDNIYVAGLYNQQIINPDLSYLSHQTFSQGMVGDFSYDPNLPNHIYAIDYDPYLQLLDYGNQKTIFSYPINSAFTGSKRFGLITSPDDLNIITYSEYFDNTASKSQIVIYRTEMFK